MPRLRVLGGGAGYFSQFRYQVPLVIHENFRWMPWYREAARMIAAGLLGTLHAIAFRLRPGDGYAALLQSGNPA